MSLGLPSAGGFAYRGVRIEPFQQNPIHGSRRLAPGEMYRFSDVSGYTFRVPGGNKMRVFKQRGESARQLADRVKKVVDRAMGWS